MNTGERYKSCVPAEIFKEFCKESVETNLEPHRKAGPENVLFAGVFFSSTHKLFSRKINFVSKPIVRTLSRSVLQTKFIKRVGARR